MQTVNLNYDWKYSEVFDEALLRRDADDSTWESVKIPHANKITPYNNFNEKTYQFVSVYRRRLNVPEAWRGKALILTFEAVANYAEVYVNGRKAFEHKGGYTAFSADIAPFVDYGTENVIAVKVDSTEREEIPPFGGVVDYLCYGGIYREVYLYVHEPVYARRLQLTPLDVLTQPKIEARLFFNQTADGTPVRFALTDAEGKVAETKQATAAGDTCAVVFEVKNANLWDTENPYLYTVTADFGEETIADRCGIRCCEFRKKGFFLNGKPLKIRGLNRHQSYPYVGYAMPKSAQEADAAFLKYHLGLNTVRTSHYPNSKHFLNRCDELGLMVVTEIPGWQYVSDNEEWRALCLQHVEEMITQQYNHPSIILWGVRINESGDDKKLYTATNKLARELDRSRQTGGVRCTPRSQLLEDVYTYNDFMRNASKTPTLPKFIVCGNVPYLITEFAGHMFPTKSFDHEKKRQEHALYHARMLNKVYATKGISGCIGWCMSDYNTHKDFGSGDKICYHGVSDMFRMDKLAANVYKIQQREIPVLELSSNMEIGDNAGGQVGDVYLFTNCDSVVIYKNGKKINTLDMAALRSKSPFKHIPVPPVPLDDIIGDQLEHDEDFHFKKRDADSMKKALLAVKKFGTLGGIIRHPLALLKCMIKYGMGITDITLLFGKYVTSWGGEQITYKFEGVMDGKPVVTVEKGSVNAVQLFAQADRAVLTEAETYDVTRVQLKALSQCGNVMPYDNSVVDVRCEGPIEIIGDSRFSMIGGQRAFWVKTTGESGTATLRLSSPTLGEQTITLDVRKI